MCLLSFWRSVLNISTTPLRKPHVIVGSINTNVAEITFAHLSSVKNVFLCGERGNPLWEQRLLNRAAQIASFSFIFTTKRDCSINNSRFVNDGALWIMFVYFIFEQDLNDRKWLGNSYDTHGTLLTVHRNQNVEVFDFYVLLLKCNLIQSLVMEKWYIYDLFIL